MSGIKIKRKRKIKIIRLVFILVVFYLIYKILSDQLYISELRKQSAGLKDEYSEQAEQNERLKEILAADDNGALLEEIARKELGYAYPDERVFVDVGGK